MSSYPWMQVSYEDICRLLQTDPQRGLSVREAEQRLHEKGRNVLQGKKKISLLLLFLMQFRDFMVLVLFGAILLSAVLGEYSDALVIMCIVVINAVLGFIQEYRAEKSLEALKELSAPTAVVIRDGVRKKVPAGELVPGDLVVIEAGDLIPADIRLGEAKQLAVNEAALTGESEPVNKDPDTLYENATTLGDRMNMLYLGTMAVSGRGSGIVVATGMETELGKIADMIQEAEEKETPLQRRLAQLGKYLVGCCLLICGLVVLMGLARGMPAYRMLMAGVSLAVAAIPEGLPAVVTIALAIGVQRMVKRNALVRKLPAVETLGCATVICSDKTGTLTQNKMNVRQVWTNGTLYNVEGDGYSPAGRYFAAGKAINPRGDEALKLTLAAAALCNNARLYRKKTEIKALWRGGEGDWHIHGDPTEGALLVAGARAGVWREDLEREMRRIAEKPFDGRRKRMSVLYQGKEERVLYVKGAPEVILERCSWIYCGEGRQKLSEDSKELILKQNEIMTSQALRNIAVAYRPVAAEEREAEEKHLVFLGLLGMIDPPRPEALQAIRKCQKAGIKTVMITGDHKNTAVAVARFLQLLPKGGHVLTGRELDNLSDEELAEYARKTYVYARVTPEHKLRIVRALKKNGHIVAMTGDGVNDAPAVKEADIGIAMGKSGTDVTREAASLVLADDNFATIVAAVEEGRSIYSNIRKFIRFLLASNTGEILTMFITMLVGMPLPLRAIQILWINLVTDGLPAMALGFDTVEEDVMERPPRMPGEGIFSGGLWEKIIGRGVVIGLTTVLVFTWGLKRQLPLAEARTLAFVTLIVTQLVYVFDCRSEDRQVWQTGILSNLWMAAAVFSSFCLLLLVLYHPLLAAVFETTPLSAGQWLLVITASLVPFLFNLLLTAVKALSHPRVVVVKK
jgi:Ca2+-transporting ATPase